MGLLLTAFSRRRGQSVMNRKNETKMEKDYKPILKAFVKEIRSLGNPAFKDTNRWHLCEDVSNGVDISHEIDNKENRMLLHEISQKHGLIAFCPDDLLDVEYSNDNQSIKQFVVRSKNGPLKIRKKS
jgi:hypothetical protein